jgi:hypothetical protein
VEPTTTSDSGATTANGTATTPVAATQPPAGAGATDQGATTGQPNSDGTVTLKDEDYKALIAQRDRANNQVKDGTVDDGVYDSLNMLLKDKVVADISKKYPDVPKEILESAADPEQMETLAKASQAHAEKVKQDALASLQTVTQPQMSGDERAAALKKAETDGDFEAMVALRTPKNF